ncbi:hypothetical protein ARAM_001410 [Aspergillus rambellii]|uniref:DEAD/DEAH box helicase n=1 Tax=Aspergillus rambellii TaxID=308745 RepID=A0A0F8X6D9_9EURO|nr:hypothetical protein ARAM_001410 [Aspergillus rambellii]
MAGSGRLLKWFDSLASRTLDLVGDYAGDELFIIEGDSVLLHCFSDEQLDFSSGFQLLHAAYTMEKFLSQLHQRKCVFHVVFFSEHEIVCTPPNIDDSLRPRYLLAREVLVQHLSENLPNRVPSIQVKRFSTYNCDAFKEYLHSAGAYFLMCHDGAFPELDRSKSNGSDEPEILESDDEDSDSSEYDHSVAPKDVSLWPGKIAMSMIIEGSAAGARQLYTAQEFTPESYNNKSSPISQIGSNLASVINRAEAEEQNEGMIKTLPDTISLIDKMPDEKTSKKILETVKSGVYNLTQREWITLLTLAYMYKTSSFERDDTLAAHGMLLHIAIMRECKLSERANSCRISRVGQLFLERYCRAMSNILSSSLWNDITTQAACTCDVADVVDGRLFFETFRLLEQYDNVSFFLSSSVFKRFEFFQNIMSDLFGVGLKLEERLSPKKSGKNAKKALLTQPVVRISSGEEKGDSTLLTFSNPVLDFHLRPVSVVTDGSADDDVSSAMSRIFQELSHWHNHRCLLNPKTAISLTDRQLMLMNRRNQFFMSDIRRYAASLTNSSGGILEPESVFVKSKEDKDRMASLSGVGPITTILESSRNILPSQAKKHNKKLPGRDQIVLQQQWKQKELAEKQISNWKAMVGTQFDREKNYCLRYSKVKQYLLSLSEEKRRAAEVEILAYMVSTLALLWKEKCITDHRSSSLSVVALMWHTIQQIAKARCGITEEIAVCIRDIIRDLQLPELELLPQEKRGLSFQFASLRGKQPSISLGMPPVEFQLIHAGPYLDRNMGSAPDPRVRDFEPDKWQREILDQIDSRRSLFVVAPTSAGKTFISFYAIKQILEDDNEGVLVYVAPTKALVNQIAAEVQARFSKSFKNPAGKSVWAIHTRDYRINNPMGCQVLVTVPHILQIMLLAPSNATKWSPRVKRIIFDEVHCIGQAQDGVVWEQLLLLAPCPIIALSATVGNPQEFKEWLSLTQRANGIELRMIEHKARYSDLRKFIYRPPDLFLFNGLSTPGQLPPLGLDDSPNFSFMHPVVSLIDRARGMPDDLTLEPRDCWMLWRVMNKHQTQEFPVDTSLNPAIALPKLIKKADIFEWEGQLKNLLNHWMDYKESPFNAVIEELSQGLHDTAAKAKTQVSSGRLPESPILEPIRKGHILDTTLPLICSLHDQGALPALIFNYDRSYCEKICGHILEQLEEAEDSWKESSSLWKKKMSGWAEWQKMEARRTKTKQPRRQRETGGEEDKKTSKGEQIRENASKDSNPMESFNPDAPVSGFHLADEKKLHPSEFEKYATELRCRAVQEWLIRALQRGVGVHHAGMNRRYRQVCEILFRKGYLRVVIATGTLALGINMPCKTVVFSGDSVYLTALNFRQAAGRAGRRGFDFLGNVVFQDVPYAKVCRLLSSRLPDLNGHFPITTSLVLRLFILLHESNQAPYAARAINSILSCPRIYLGGSESKHTVLHHLRFSIEYLRRNCLLSRTGAPLNFAGTISHLYYTETSSFSFHALLSNGYFHQLCKGIRRRPEQTLLDLMLVMSHLFGRYHLRPSVLESRGVMSKRSTSVVILPALPGKATKILDAHNKKTLSIFSAYVSTFIDQHIQDSDCILPLTGIKCGGDQPAEDISKRMEFLPPNRVNSAFVSLSGHLDGWDSIPQLCKMVRSGVWLEQAVIPYAEASPAKGQAPLNAYLYDFYKHGNVHALVTENMVRKGDLWFVLNDFSLVLATIVTSLENFLKLSPNTDPCLLETMGSGDALEEESDNKAFEAAEGHIRMPDSYRKESRPTVQPKAKHPGSTSFKDKDKDSSDVAENWDDALSDEDNNKENTSHGVLNVATNKSKKTERKNPNPPKETMKHDTSKQTSNTNAGDTVLEGAGIMQVLQAFRMLQQEFNNKFRVTWA